jgi:hypothetical protein
MKSFRHPLRTLLCLGLVLGFLLPARAEDQNQAAEAMTTLLKSIPLKDLKYENAPLAKVLSDLQEAAKAVLPPDSKASINLIYKTQGKNNPTQDPSVSLNLKNTSLYEALTMIGMLNGLEVQVNAKGVLLTQSESLSLSSW